MTAPQTPYLPAGLPLPYYARIDLAYSEPQYFGAAGAGLVYTTTAPAGAFSVVTYACWTVVTSATVAARTILVQYVDQTGATLWQVPAAQLVPENSTVAVTMVTGYSSTLTVGNTITISVPPTLIRPGDRLWFTANNWQAGDQITALNFARLVIPTGPAADEPTPAAVPIRL